MEIIGGIEFVQFIFNNSYCSGMHLFDYWFTCWYFEKEKRQTYNHWRDLSWVFRAGNYQCCRNVYYALEGKCLSLLYRNIFIRSCIAWLYICKNQMEKLVAYPYRWNVGILHRNFHSNTGCKHSTNTISKRIACANFLVLANHNRNTHYI